MDPPRPSLDWETVIETTNLAELDLLRDTRLDIRKLDWAKPEHRKAAGLFFEMERAQEEIARLNVEIRRTLTAMADEHADYWFAVGATIFEDPALAFELSSRWRRRDAINRRAAERLRQISLLKGFTGSLSTGKRTGRDMRFATGIILPSWMDSLAAEGQSNDEAEDDEMDNFAEANGLLSFVEGTEVDG